MCQRIPNLRNDNYIIWYTIEPRLFPLSLISILFTVLWLDVCTMFLKPFYYIFGSCSSANDMVFSSKRQRFYWISAFETQIFPPTSFAHHVELDNNSLVIWKIGKSYVCHLFCQCFFVTLRCISFYRRVCRHCGKK